MTNWKVYACPSCGARVSIRANSTASVETCSHTGRRALKPSVMTLVAITDAVESGADTNGGRKLLTQPRPPEPQTEEAVSDLLGQGSRTVKQPAKARH